MTNQFIESIKNEQTVGKTFNGGATNTTTGSRVLDLFSTIGSRNINPSNQFDRAVEEDSKLAFRVALWARNPRGGAGERQTFRNLLSHLERFYKEETKALIPVIPIIGRWDDLLTFTNADIKKEAYSFIKDCLFNKLPGYQLCAKWMPSKGPIALELSEFFEFGTTDIDIRTKTKKDKAGTVIEEGKVIGKTKVPSKKYRNFLASLDTSVERLMTQKKWHEIIFDHVPSRAAKDYQKAFSRNCGARYVEYIEGLKKVKEDGTTERKIHASTLFPYEVIRAFNKGEREVAEAQWKALPNYLGDNMILPIVDVSGSMSSWGYYGQRNSPKGNVTPIEISVSLGLYCASKQRGAFNGAWMHFSSNPRMQFLKGSLGAMINDIIKGEWGSSTNIEGAFKEILQFGKRNNVPNSDMPKMLLIMSDMEFDACVRRDQTAHNSLKELLIMSDMEFDACVRRDQTAHNSLKEQYEKEGYTIPKVVYWVLNGREGNKPVTMKDEGTAIVSGFSPAILKSILSDKLESFSPWNVMMEALRDKVYDVPGVTI